MCDPTRDFPDQEIVFSLHNWGGWFGWFGERPDEAIRALRWKASQGDVIPGDLELLRDAIAQFGYAPIEDAVGRVQGLERAYREIAELLDRGSGCSPDDVEAAREIVESCVRYSGGFGPPDENGGSGVPPNGPGEVPEGSSDPVSEHETAVEVTDG